MRLKQDATWPCIATQRKCFLGKVDFSQDARVANALASEIGGRVGEIIGWAGRDLFRRGALLRRRCFWIFSFIIVIIFFFFLIFSTLWVFKQKQTTLPPPSVFHLVIIAAATAAERAGSFLLSSESQLPATQDKAWLYLFISTIKETWKQIETVPVDCQPAFNFHGDFTPLADRIAQWKWCL